MPEASYYLQILDNFVSRGDMPEREDGCRAWQRTDDPLLDYLVQLMDDPETQMKVLSSRIRGRVFYTCVGRFVVDCLGNKNFQRQRQWTERKQASDIVAWSMGRREDGWQTLLEQIDKEHEDDGFPTQFYRQLFVHNDGWKEPANWEKLSHDWQKCMDRWLLKKQKEHIEKHNVGTRNALNLALRQLQEHMRQHSVSEDKALQAWDMMEGQWTETEFEKHLKTVKIQEKYPEIERVAIRMGRIADSGGRDRMAIANGSRMKLSHSSGSDIEGITVGNDLGALLPIELAEYGDELMGDLFMYKYFTKRLQTFRYKSQMSKPSRQLSFTHAQRRGPMIICIDTSASMYGTAQRIEASLLGRVEQVAEELGRDCFLIDFSVSVRPVDLMEKKREMRMAQLGIAQSAADDGVTTTVEADRSSLLQVTERKREAGIPFIGGGTSADRMLSTMYELLDNDGKRYVNADVLWITDFLIPMADHSMLSRLDSYRHTGTKFYGMQITSEESGHNEWERFFDHIYHIHYRTLHRY